MTDISARKVACITGAARGIGKAIALDLARDHAVAITYLTTPPEGLPESVLAIKVDLRDSANFAIIVEAVIDRFGRLDVLVNNAGAVTASPIDGYDPEACRALLDVNLLAPHGLLSAALPYLQEGAAIVGISSVNAVLPPNGAVLYGASKAALDLWTRGMAKELGSKGIGINAVAPGAVNITEEPRDAALTKAFADMTALGRLATPDDIAAAVRFLASDRAACITGEVLTVSGGYRL